MWRRVVAALTTIAMLAIGSQLAVAGARTYEFIASPVGFPFGIGGVSNDGRLVLAGTTLGDLRSGTTWSLRTDRVAPSTMSGDGQLAYGADSDTGDVFRWSLPNGAPTLQPIVYDGPGFSPQPNGLQASSDGHQLLVNASSGVLAEERVYLADTSGGAPAVNVARDLTTNWPQSFEGVMTPDARHVAYAHRDPFAAGWMVPQVVVYDAATGVNTVVSTSAAGTFADAAALWPSISPNGRFVTFQSSATNLVAGATSSTRRLYLRDRQTGITVVVAELAAGFGLPALVDDAARIVFVNTGDVSYSGQVRQDSVIYEWVSGTAKTVLGTPDGSPPDSGVYPSPMRMNADGSVVVFLSWASNVTAAPNPNGELAMLRPPATEESPTTTTTTTSTTTTTTTTTATSVPVSVRGLRIDGAAVPDQPARRHPVPID